MVSGFLKSNIVFRRPARLSKDPVIRWPPSQLSSTNRRIEDLVGHGVIDVVLLRVGRDHQQRKTWTISATSLGMLDGDTRKGASLQSRIGRYR